MSHFASDVCIGLPVQISKSGDSKDLLDALPNHVGLYLHR